MSAFYEYSVLQLPDVNSVCRIQTTFEDVYVVAFPER